LNSIIFGTIAVLSLFVFFNLGKVRASEKQRNRENKIDWSVRKYHNFYKGFLVMVVVVLLTALLISFFI
tara:strand:+ start:199 stop:405 length:207 start_codon:yes stop_codon:yes gene_type:complete